MKLLLVDLSVLHGSVWHRLMLQNFLLNSRPESFYSEVHLAQQAGRAVTAWFSGCFDSCVGAALVGSCGSVPPMDWYSTKMCCATLHSCCILCVPVHPVLCASTAHRDVIRE